MSLPPFEILEHTADIGVRARGPSLAALFENAAAGLLDVAFDAGAVQTRESRTLTADGPDRETLLVAWLDEILWLVDGEGWLPARIEVHQISETRVTGVARGEPRDPSRHLMRMIVKAITLHQLSVREEKGAWVAEVYLDI